VGTVSRVSFITFCICGGCTGAFCMPPSGPSVRACRTRAPLLARMLAYVRSRMLAHVHSCAARARALYELGSKPCQSACQRPCVSVSIAHSMRLRVCARTRGKRGKGRGRGRWPRRGMRRVCVCGCGGLFTFSQSSNISLSLMSIRSSLNWVRRVCHPARSPRLCVHGCHAQELGALNAITFRRLRRSSK
jgi:hypothetical protein